MNESSQPLAIIAVGGNSLIKDPEHMSVLDQYQAAGETAEHIAAIVTEGYRVVITHGNGPQVGFILLRSELAKDKVHQVPLQSCVADTQGAIGYQIKQTLNNELRSRGVDLPIAALVTQVEVDPDDPAFENPSKPIGPFYEEAEARAHEADRGWEVIEDAGRGWRRVVASPKPLSIIEAEIIEKLVEQGVIVIAVGGGGIPVVRNEQDALEGRPAVIDKDAASCLLAKLLKADIFLLSTAVHKVALDFGKPSQRFIDQMTVAEAKRFSREGHFGKGSMQPKIDAAIDYLENGGKKVIITEPHFLEDGLQGKNGTLIVP